MFSQYLMDENKLFCIKTVINTISFTLKKHINFINLEDWCKSYYINIRFYKKNFIFRKW